jgi:hypothetical protein
MKKIIITLAVIIGMTVTAQSQGVSKNALGLRLGSNDGFGGELSYQRKLAANNRLELDLGFRNSNNINAFKLAALYQWVMNIEGGFNWYVGVGGGLGSWSYDNKFGNDSGTFLFVAGDLGIEYNFDVPIQLALDIRPELYFNSSAYRTSNFGPDIALSIRYRFN